jgi:hypothetical protein
MRVLLLLLLALLLAVASAAASTLGYEYDTNEPRLQLEADVPMHTLGRARHFVAEARVTEKDELDLQFVLRREPEQIEALHEVHSVRSLSSSVRLSVWRVIR